MLYDFIVKCLDKNQHTRPWPNELMFHPWMMDNFLDAPYMKRKQLDEGDKQLPYYNLFKALLRYNLEIRKMDKTGKPDQTVQENILDYSVKKGDKARKKDLDHAIDEWKDPMVTGCRKIVTL